MQSFSQKASSVLEKKIFKGFYHIWAWQPSWSMDCNHFSNLSFPCPREAPNEIWATLTQRLQRRSFEILHIFSHTNPASYFGRPPIPDKLYKDSAIRHSRFWRRRFLKVFNIYGHGSHLGQWTATILAIFHFPAPGRLQMKFVQHWPKGFRGKVVWNSEHFSYANA